MTLAVRPSWSLFLPGAALFAAIYGPVLFAPPGYAPATRDSDFYMYYFPMTEAAFEMLRGGHMPLWNPYIDSGLPFLASIELGILYPPNWLHLVLPAERAFCVLYVLHVLLAAGGTWFYARGRGRSPGAALFSAQAFAFAAPTILHHDMGMTSVVYSSAWFPLIFAIVDRCLRLRTAGSACVLAVVLACQFLAGFPMFSLLLAALIPAYLAVFGIDWRRPMCRANGGTILLFGTAAILALGLVAPQLLATWEYAENSQRGDLGYEQSTHCCFPAPNLMTLVVPEFFGNDQGCQYWGEAYLFDANAFCGTTTVFLALLAVMFWRNREVLFWSAVGAVILAFALGKYSWFYDLCYVLVPGVNRFRGVSRLVIFVVFGLAVLAGIGLDGLLAGNHLKGRRRLSWAVGVPAAGIAVWAGCLLAAGSNAPSAWQSVFEWVRGPGAELPLQIPAHLASRFLQISFVTLLKSLSVSGAALLGASLLIGGGVFTLRDQRWRVLGLVTLLAAELYWFDARHVVLMETEPWRLIARRIQSVLADDQGLYRVAAYGHTPPLPLNRFLYGRLQDVGGHENFVPYRYSLFLDFWLGIEPQWQTYLTVPNSNRIYDLLNVKYFVTFPENGTWGVRDELVREWAFQHQGRNHSLYRNGTALPRVSLIHAAHRAMDLKSAFHLLEPLREGGTVDIETVIEGDPGISLEPVSDAARRDEHVTVVEYSAQRIVVDAHCRGPGLLLYSENYFPGWEARVDGQEAPVLPANVFMRAVPVTAGDHRVEMSYRPAPYRIGCWLAAAALVIILLQFTRLCRRSYRIRVIRRSLPSEQQ
ncbi:MAG: YfhO family protein [Planctomycetia bacterium]|nr:YfhO family protein [Planctomycetia bacterium]